MSTYLIAFLVSNFEFISNEGVQNPIYNIPFRVYSRRGTQNTAAFALDFGQRNMVALENYTQFAYALPKIDKVAVPDFAAGAMENWGLVVYRYVKTIIKSHFILVGKNKIYKSYNYYLNLKFSLFK